MSTITCCKNCVERTDSCHSTCWKYIGQKKQHEEKKEAERLRRLREQPYWDRFYHRGY